MESQVVSWLISLVIGAIGGNAAGALFKKWSLGPIWNTVIGLVGGGLGGQILGALLGGGGPSGIVGNLLGSGVGSAVLLALIGWLRTALADKP